MLYKYGLDRDIEIRDLVAMRDSHSVNMLQRQKVHMEMSNELKERKEIAFSLNVMEGVFGLDANVKSNIETLKRVIYECEVEFG